ncbi:MAG: serine hydrolase, partial [Bacteroidota bacterium]
GIDSGAFPGAQVMVLKNQKVIFHETYGHHTYAQARRVQPDDVYDLASVTKISSALAGLMRLHGQGNFDLDAPLVDYFPQAKGSNKANLQFREMLSHQARLRPWIPYWRTTLKGNARYPWQKRYQSDALNEGRFKPRTFRRDSSARFPTYVTDDLWLHRNYRQRIYKAILKSPLQEKREYVYSGLLFYLLPEIVANITGEDYETYLKSALYHPLGAFSITYNPWRFYPKERIIPTEQDTFFRQALLHGRVHDEGAAMMAGLSANAGLFANANDLAKLLQLYLNEGQYGGEQLIAATSVQEFRQRHYAADGNRRGIGFDKPLLEYDPVKSSVAEAASSESFGHSGYTGTFVWVDPAEDLIFIFLSNRVHPTRDNRYIYTLNIRPRIHSAIYQAIEK